MNPPLSTTDVHRPVEEEIFIETFTHHDPNPKTGSKVYDKLPAVVGLFWVLKIAATTLGETAGDLFAQTLKVGYGFTSAVMFTLLFVALVAQIPARQYRPWIY